MSTKRQAENYRLRVPAVPLSPEGYQAAVAKVVAQFERDTTRRRPLGSYLHRMLVALETLGRPATYAEVADAMGEASTGDAGWLVSSRLRRLVNVGYARIVGKKPQTWHRRGANGSENDVTFQVTLYELVAWCPAKTAAIAKARLERQMDLLDGRKALGMCIVSSWSFTNSERNQQMIGERAKGRSMVDIGKEYGVTRERVRQVVARAVNKRREVHVNGK